MRGRVWGPLAIAIALASMTAGGIVISQGDGGGTPAPTGLANIWVDGSGTCADSAILVAYDSATACATFDNANDTCEGGDTVRVVEKVGGYGDQTLTGNTRSGSYCTFTVDEGTTIDMGSDDNFEHGDALTVCSNYTKFVGTTSRADALVHSSNFPSHVNTGVRDGFNFFDVSMDVHSNSCPAAVSFVEFRDVSMSRFGVTGSNHISLYGGQVGPLLCGDEGAFGTNEDMMTLKSRPNPYLGVTFVQVQDDILLDGVIFHDHIKRLQAVDALPTDPEECLGHIDMIQWYNGTDITVRNSQFLRVGDQGFFGRCETDGCTQAGTVDNWLIENNYFAAPVNTGNALVMANSGSFPCTNIVVRYNSMEANRPEFGCTDTNDGGVTPDVPITNVQIYGNLFYQNANQPTGAACTLATWTYNFYFNPATGTCGGTGESVWNGSGTVMTDVANDDFTLTPGSSARTKGNPSACPTTDYNGETRPQPVATTCDAGADEVG